MSYVDGFVIAVPSANKDRFIEHANVFDSMLIEEGALRVVECWGDDVPAGKRTDFLRAVEANHDETVCLSWVEWPDKATRDAVHARMQEKMTSGAFDGALPEMPFDGARMIFGGFDTIIEMRAKP